MNTILYTVATDNNGKFINANDAEKGNDFFCPQCKTELILRKSGKTGKGTKRPHFAHYALTPNCTPESALHYSFKRFLAEKLEQNLKDRKPLLISWKCKYCGDTHSGNLLKKIRSLRIEYNMGVCQPDIALLDSDGQAFAVVEVVVMHKPEESVVEFYEENKIILIQIELTSDKDIDNLDHKIANPDHVGICYNPRCEICGQYQQRTKMTIVDCPCWSCGVPMKVAVVHGAELSSGSHLGPDKFTKKELEFAQSKGVFISKKYSETMREKYLANTCRKCQSFVGNHYLFMSYFAPAACGDLPSTEFEIGHHCNHRRP